MSTRGKWTSRLSLKRSLTFRKLTQLSEIKEPTPKLIWDFPIKIWRKARTLRRDSLKRVSLVERRQPELLGAGRERCWEEQGDEGT